MVQRYARDTEPAFEEIDLAIFATDDARSDVPSLGSLGEVLTGGSQGTEPGDATPFQEGAPAHHHVVLILSPVGSGCSLESEGVNGLVLRQGPDRVWTAAFDRPAPTYKDALRYAFRDVQSRGWAVRRVAPDDLVTQAEIANRLGRTSESIRLLSGGQRGNRTFPPPVVRATNRGSLWRWSQVAVWADRPSEEVDKAEWIAAVNVILQIAEFKMRHGHRILREVDDMLVSTGLLEASTNP